MTPTMPSPDTPVEDIDRLLTSFFQKEVPKSWPALSVPAPRRTTSGWRFLAFRSRLALAASLALLAGGTLLLGSTFRAVNSQMTIPGLEQGSARQESIGKIRSDMFLEQQRDGPTTIKINIQELPGPR